MEGTFHSKILLIEINIKFGVVKTVKNINREQFHLPIAIAVFKSNSQTYHII